MHIRTILLVGMLSLVSMGAGCAAGPETPWPPQTLILDDNSISRRSLGGEQPDPGPTRTNLVSRWAREADTGSSLEIWRFTPHGSALEVTRPVRILKPEPKPPVRFWLDDFQKAVVEEVDRRLQEGPVEGVGWSPLLEGTWRLMERGSGLQGDYQIVLLGPDLLQTSPGFTFSRDYLSRCTDDAIVARVGERLPALPRPPRRALICYYPGATGDDVPVTGTYESRLKEIYRRVLTEVWHVPQVDEMTLQ